MRKSNEMKEEIKKRLIGKRLALHFDGKHINGCEHQVALVKNK